MLLSGDMIYTIPTLFHELHSGGMPLQSNSKVSVNLFVNGTLFKMLDLLNLILQKDAHVVAKQSLGGTKELYGFLYSLTNGE